MEAVANRARRLGGLEFVCAISRNRLIRRALYGTVLRAANFTPMTALPYRRARSAASFFFCALWRPEAAADRLALIAFQRIAIPADVPADLDW